MPYTCSVQFFLLIQLLLAFIDIPQKPLAAGDKLPSCTFLNASGETVNTDSLRGNILVMDFWASWNIPSRSHNKQLIKLYEKYRTINFRKKHQILFLSISLDTQRELWLVARAKDNLHWHHNICDFKGWDSEVMDQLNINIIPANFVIDREGEIAAKNSWGMELDSTLRELNKEMPN